MRNGKEIKVIEAPGTVDIHRQKIKYIINYIVRKWGLGNDPISSIGLRTFLAAVNGMSDEEVEDIFKMVKQVVEK